MLLLTFRVDHEIYAVDVTRVVEVVPKVEPRPIPRTPSFLAGLFGYRGRVVPAIDMGLLLGKAPAPNRLSTRVILVEARKIEAGQALEVPTKVEASRVRVRSDRMDSLLLGLIAEQVNDVVHVGESKVAFPSMRLVDAPFLGEMIQIDPGAQSLAQLIDVDRVLPPSLRDALFGGWEKTDEQADIQSATPVSAGDLAAEGSGLPSKLAIGAGTQ